MRGTDPPAEGDKLLGVDRGASEAGLDERSCKEWRQKSIITLGSKTELARLAAGLSPPQRCPLSGVKGQQGCTILGAVKIPEWGVTFKVVRQHEHTDMDIRTRTERWGMATSGLDGGRKKAEFRAVKFGLHCTSAQQTMQYG